MKVQILKGTFSQLGKKEGDVIELKDAEADELIKIGVVAKVAGGGGVGAADPSSGSGAK